MQQLLIMKTENSFPTDLKDHYFLYRYENSSLIHEGKVLCYSPSLKYVKILQDDERPVWNDIMRVYPLEDLGKQETSAGIFQKELLLEEQNGLRTTSIFNDNHGLSHTTITESKANQI